MKSWLNPKWRAVLFMAAANAIWVLAAVFWFSRAMWSWITPIALSINALLLTYDQVLSFARSQVNRVVGQDPWGVLNLVNELSERLKVPPPQVYIVSSSAAQILSYGMTGKSIRLLVTEGALNLLTRDELAAVVTYQLCAIQGSFHILNYWVGAAADMVLRAGRAGERLFGLVFGWSPKISVWLLKPLLWILHRGLLSSRDYTRLDQAAASHLPDPEPLARALWKLEAYAHTRPWAEAWVFAHMCMVSPLATESGFVQHVPHIHPPLSGRIKTLIGRYPI